MRGRVMGCCEPFAYVANANVAQVDEGGYVPLGEVVHYACGACTLNGNSVMCRGKGAFDVSATLVVSQVDTSGSTPPLLAATLTQDGQPIQGGYGAANSSGTVTIPLHAVIRNDSCSATSVAVMNVGPAVRVNGVSMTVRPIR